MLLLLVRKELNGAPVKMCDWAFFFLERDPAEVGERARRGEKEGSIYEGVGFAILSDDGGCSVDFESELKSLFQFRYALSKCWGFYKKNLKNRTGTKVRHVFFFYLVSPKKKELVAFTAV